MLLDLMNTWKAFYASCCLWKCIPCKKLLRCLSKWYSQLVKSQVNMADEAKLHSPIHSTSEALVTQCGWELLGRRIGLFLLNCFYPFVKDHFDIYYVGVFLGTLFCSIDLCV